MTLTDEEAREIVAVLRESGSCVWCDGRGNRHASASTSSQPTMDRCSACKGTGVGLPEARRLITLLESRIGQPDDLTAAYQFGFERGRDAGRKERG